MKGSETLRSALRSDRTKLNPEDDEDDESVEQAASEADKDDSVPELPTSDSASSVSLSSDLKLFCTDRLGIVNCGMLSGVRIFR